MTYPPGLGPAPQLALRRLEPQGKGWGGGTGQGDPGDGAKPDFFDMVNDG